ILRLEHHQPVNTLYQSIEHKNLISKQNPPHRHQERQLHQDSISPAHIAITPDAPPNEIYAENVKIQLGNMPQKQALSRN
ncbi:hypothetical protein, partial [Pseudomonas syringae group genomosp. 7]|uniref:hypothetical protein n=1 Tax=Pseudomonas syringae group genomosp. 7 TaxID=251699 RepID=UPI00376FA652